MYGGHCDAAIAKAAAVVIHVQSQSQEIGSGDEGLGLFGFDLSSAETYFWRLEDQRLRLSFSSFIWHLPFIVEADKPVFSACTHRGGCP